MPALEERPAAQPLNRVSATTYAGNADFHRTLCDLLDGAQFEVADYVIPETRPDEHDIHIMKAYGNANRRGVHCRTLISAPHLELVQRTWDPAFDMRSFLDRITHIRLVDRVNGPFTVVDRRYVFLNVANALDPAEYTSSVVIDDEKLASHLLTAFDHVWNAVEAEQERLIREWESTRV